MYAPQLYTATYAIVVKRFASNIVVRSLKKTAVVSRQPVAGYYFSKIPRINYALHGYMHIYNSGLLLLDYVCNS